MKEEDLGQVDIDDEANARKGKMYIPNWFSVEVKTGVRMAPQESTMSCSSSCCDLTPLSCLIRCCQFVLRRVTVSLPGSWEQILGWTLLSQTSNVSKE